ncbi:ShlB/FhaC/HecB family hemolysin secretion/activation protein [Alteraurantiacibacter buctensis]|nr:ShlB/FhaC/HecB family hemolysin secretion/activation protein [Alteraurantiacibacter buctensis]
MLALAAGLGSSAALAQQLPPGAVTPPTRSELLPPEVRQDERRTTISVDGGLERGPCALDDPAMAEIRVTLSSVRFTGAEAAPGVDLDEAARPYLGRELPLSVLCDIRARASEALADAGYLAAVEIPEQRLDGGAAELRVIVGRLVAVRVRGEPGGSMGVLERYLQHLVDQPVFNVNEAERYLLLADDIPGMDVRLSLRAAANGQPGDLIGEIAVVAQSAQVSFNLQNMGSRELGRFGGTLGAQVYGLTGLGDVTSISLFSSHDFAEQQTVQVAHDFLAGGDGLKLGGQLTLGWAHPTLGIAGFDVRSETLFGSVRAAWPLVRTQAQAVVLSTGLDIVDQDVRANRFLLSRDRVRVAWLRMDGSQTDSASLARQNGYTPYEPRLRLAYGMELRRGLSILGANPDCRAALLACTASKKLPSRIEQDPTATLLRLDLAAEFRPVPAFTVAVRVAAQGASNALPAFEEMTGGNYSTGRGYDPGAITGDRGVSGSLEFRLGSLIPRGADAYAVQPFAFVDAARLNDRDPSQRGLNPDKLVSVGGGVRFAWARGMQGEVAMAVPLHRTDNQVLGGRPHGDARLLFSITSRLLPWGF